MDYPHVRASGACPLCRENKDFGLIVCWECYHNWNLRYGNLEAELLIEQAETKLRDAHHSTGNNRVHM